MKILLFKIGEFNFGIELQYLHEIGKFKDFFKIPTSVEYFEGIFNLRGKIIPLINLAKRVGLNYNILKDTEKLFLILNDSENIFGVKIDKVIGIVEINEDKIYKNSIEGLNFSIIPNIVYYDNELISLIDVKSIINKDDFRFKKKFLYKTVESFEEVKEEPKIKESPKVKYIICQFNDNYYAIDSKNVVQLIQLSDEKFKLKDITLPIVGELEFNKIVLPVFNFPKLIGKDFKYTSNLEDYYILICSYDNIFIALLVFYTVEFIEIEEKDILIEENLFLPYNFFKKCFKLNDKLVRIIDLKAFVDFIKTGKMLEK